jgi:hypothetical protein
MDALDAPESKRLLATILAAHPELVAEAAELANAQLGALTLEDVAADVAFALGELRVEDVWERSGAQPGGAYVEPTEAAWDLVYETMAPFIEDLARRVELGRRGEATALCQGALRGLYEISQQERELLDGYAPDALWGAAGLVVAAWKKGDKREVASAGRAKQLAAMGRFVSDALPEWRSSLTRALQHMPKRSREERKARDG